MGGLGSPYGQPGHHSPNGGGSVSSKRTINRSEWESRCLWLSVLPFRSANYLGPDYTADYLRRSALSVRESYGGEGSDTATTRTVEDFKENRYDLGTNTLQFTAAQAAAYEELTGHYGRYFG